MIIGMHIMFINPIDATVNWKVPVYLGQTKGNIG